MSQMFWNCFRSGKARSSWTRSSGSL